VKLNEYFDSAKGLSRSGDGVSEEVRSEPSVPEGGASGFSHDELLKLIRSFPADPFQPS
jgi:hypothetical protein